MALVSIGFGVVTAGRVGATSPDEALESVRDGIKQATEPVQSRDDQSLSYEVDADGAVELDYRHLSFEAGGQQVEFEAKRPEIDFEVEPNTVELQVVTDRDAFDFQFDGDESLEFQAAGGDVDVEAERTEIEYSGVAIDFEWEKSEGVELDGDVSMEYSPGAFEWTGHELAFEWDGTDNDFEVSSVDHGDSKQEDGQTEPSGETAEMPIEEPTRSRTTERVNSQAPQRGVTERANAVDGGKSTTLRP